MRSVRRRLRRRARTRGVLAPAVSKAVTIAHAAYRLCAKKTRDSNVAVAATNAAASLAATFDLTTLRLGDRLRLEWLGAMRDADALLLGECARVLGDAIAMTREAPLSDRIRLASAEAYSLMLAVSRTGESSSEAAWLSPARSVAFLSFA